MTDSFNHEEMKSFIGKDYKELLNHYKDNKSIRFHIIRYPDRFNTNICRRQIYKYNSVTLEINPNGLIETMRFGL